MSPALTPLVSALERAASLIEKGVPPAKALRQVAHEMRDYESGKAGTAIPTHSFAHLLGASSPL